MQFLKNFYNFFKISYTYIIIYYIKKTNKSIEYGISQKFLTMLYIGYMIKIIPKKN